jgi:hypothetical protein
MELFNKIIPKIAEFFGDMMHIIYEIARPVLKIIASPFYIIKGFAIELLQYKYYWIILITFVVICTLFTIADLYYDFAIAVPILNWINELYASWPMKEPMIPSEIRFV